MCCAVGNTNKSRGDVGVSYEFFVLLKPDRVLVLLVLSAVEPKISAHLRLFLKVIFLLLIIYVLLEVRCGPVKSSGGHPQYVQKWSRGIEAGVDITAFLIIDIRTKLLK